MSQENVATVRAALEAGSGFLSIFAENAECTRRTGDSTRASFLA